MQPLRIGTVVKRSAGAFLPTGTTDQYSLALAVPPPSFKALRSDFRDTAYWSPAVVTGSDGRATITFPWPDSLTSYTATGLAVTESSDFGRGAGSALVTKDFLVRLDAPRFLRSGDAAQITGIAQGVASAKVARLRFSAPLLGVADDTTTARFDAHATASTRWNVRGLELGESSLRLTGDERRTGRWVARGAAGRAAGTPTHERAAGTRCRPPHQGGAASAPRHRTGGRSAHRSRAERARNWSPICACYGLSVLLRRADDVGSLAGDLRRPLAQAHQKKLPPARRPDAGVGGKACRGVARQAATPRRIVGLVGVRFPPTRS